MPIVTPPTGRLLVKRDGRSITGQIPKPTVLVDTREQLPFDFSLFPNWIGTSLRYKLDAGDYSILGMEHLLALERKSLTDLITTLMQNRAVFFNSCERLTQYRWRAL